MSFGEHCDLCRHQQTSLQIGMTCQLTQATPNFKNTCPNIQIKNSFQEKLDLLNIEIAKIKRSRSSVYVKFYISIIVGLAFIFVGVYSINSYSDFFESEELYLTVFTGLTACSVAYKILNKYRNELKVAKTEKRKIDLLLNKYKITYTTDIKFGKKYHGVQEVSIEMNMKGKFAKRTKTTYKINS